MLSSGEEILQHQLLWYIMRDNKKSWDNHEINVDISTIINDLFPCSPGAYLIGHIKMSFHYNFVVYILLATIKLQGVLIGAIDNYV